MSIIVDQASSSLPSSNQETDIDWSQCPAVLAVDIEGSGRKCMRKYPVVAIGAVLMALHTESGKYKEIDVIRVSAKVDKSLFEPACFADYWSRPEQAKQLEIFTKEGTDQKEMFYKFDQFVAKCYYQYPKLKVVSDGPSYDIALLDYGLSKYLEAPPLNYPRYNVVKTIVENECTERYVYDNYDNFDYTLPEDEEKAKEARKKWPQNYPNFVLCTSSMRRGAVLADTGEEDLAFKQWFSGPKDDNLYETSIKYCPYSHDHYPENDARSIAWKYLDRVRVLVNRKRKRTGFESENVVEKERDESDQKKCPRLE